MASLQALYVNAAGELNLPDTWLHLRLSDSSETYILQSQISSVAGSYTILDQLVLNSAAQQIQLDWNGMPLQLSLSEILGEELGEDMASNDDGPNDPFTLPLAVLTDPGEPICSYYVQDHLGNTRVVYKALFCDPALVNAEPIEYDVEYVGEYYPYAKTIREYIKGEKEKFLSTEHERDQETGLDYRGARFYDGDIGRFLSLDPLAAEYPTLSDYSYVAGNPMIFVDPDGRSIIPAEEGSTEAKDLAVARQNEAFNNLYNELDGDKNNVFKYSNSTNGESWIEYTGLDDNKRATFTIHYAHLNNPGPIGVGKLDALFEESYHSVDYLNGNGVIINSEGTALRAAPGENLNVEGRAWLFTVLNSPGQPSPGYKYEGNGPTGSSAMVEVEKSLYHQIKEVHNASGYSSALVHTKDALLNGYSVNQRIDKQYLESAYSPKNLKHTFYQNKLKREIKEYSKFRSQYFGGLYSND